MVRAERGTLPHPASAICSLAKPPARKVRGGYCRFDGISHNDRLLRHSYFRLKFQLFKIRNGDGAFLCFVVVIVVSPPVGQAVGAGR